MKKQINPDETLQLMRFILNQGSNHPTYGWALGVLDATLIYPLSYPLHKKHNEEYIRGYKERMEEINNLNNRDH